MKRTLLASAALVLLAWAVRGCVDQPLARIDTDAGAPCPPSAGSVQGDIPCDVAAVLGARCQVCHTVPKKHNAPFPELTYEQLNAPFGITALVRWQRMAEVIEPGAQPHMPPQCFAQLSPQQLATLRAWFQSCAPPVPQGTGCDLEDGGSFAGFPSDGGVDDAGQCD